MPIDVPAEVVNESASMYAASAENLSTEVRRVAECLVLAAMPEHRIHCLRSNGENTLKFFHHGGVNASKSWDIMTKGPDDLMGPVFDRIQKLSAQADKTGFCAIVDDNMKMIKPYLEDRSLYIEHVGKKSQFSVLCMNLIRNACKVPEAPLPTTAFQEAPLDAAALALLEHVHERNISAIFTATAPDLCVRKCFQACLLCLSGQADGASRWDVSYPMAIAAFKGNEENFVGLLRMTRFAQVPEKNKELALELLSDEAMLTKNVHQQSPAMAHIVGAIKCFCGAPETPEQAYQPPNCVGLDTNPFTWYFARAHKLHGPGLSFAEMNQCRDALTEGAQHYSDIKDTSLRLKEKLIEDIADGEKNDDMISADISNRTGKGGMESAIPALTEKLLAVQAQLKVDKSSLAQTEQDIKHAAEVNKLMSLAIQNDEWVQERKGSVRRNVYSFGLHAALLKEAAAAARGCSEDELKVVADAVYRELLQVL